MRNEPPSNDQDLAKPTKRPRRRTTTMAATSHRRKRSSAQGGGADAITTTTTTTGSIGRKFPWRSCLVPLPIFLVFFASQLGNTPYGGPENVMNMMLENQQTEAATTKNRDVSSSYDGSSASSSSEAVATTTETPKGTREKTAAATSSSTALSQHPTKIAWTIPQGSTPNLPSKNKAPPITTTTATLSPAVWRGMIALFNVKSLLDLAPSGQCLTSLWFYLHGVNAMCVHDSTSSTNSILETSQQQLLVEHDYTQGPWWPERTYDAIWAADLLDQVPVHQHFNVISTFRKAAIIVLTIEVKNGNRDIHWWTRKLTTYGFLVDIGLSEEMRKWANSGDTSEAVPTRSGVLQTSALVLINPAVTSLPWHSHLLFEHGCFAHYGEKGKPSVTRPCGTRAEETKLPKSFPPLEEKNIDAQQKWQSIVRKTFGNKDSSADNSNDNQLILDATTTFANDTWITPFELPAGLDASRPLAIPRGTTPNLPSIRVQNEKEDKQRKIYGGKGDKQHLGGFTDIDPAGISPKTWTNMIEKVGIRSIMDIGCGRGISSLWFHVHGLDTLCVEGSHDAVEKSMLPQPTGEQDKQLIVEHDFSRGPWWPEKTYDAVWCVEFLEHVGVNFHFNYITTMRKAAVLFVTSSRWGGWHHVEVHPDSWWIQKFESYGFVYNERLTLETRKWAASDHTLSTIFKPTVRFIPQHIALSVKVFINPAVASLPEHAHIIYEAGCMKARLAGGILLHRECNHTGESPLPESFIPLKVDPTAQRKWEDVLVNKTNLERLHR